MNSSDHEKRSVAFLSLVAAVGLTSFKLVVGFLTGSLGILAEAAHSGLDLVAAAATYFAVRISARPPDRNHHYGHGKVENLSALFETVLLLLTCVWIIYAAIERLAFETVHVDVTVWSFVVMITSIVVDYSRSKALYRAARKHNSQALEADALHFQTDIWSSLVVIFGLVAVKVAEWFPAMASLQHADAVAALGVALIVISISWRLAMRSVHALLDGAPAGLEHRIIEAVEAIPGVGNCHNVRMRYLGARLFVDIHVLLDGEQSLRQAHDLTEEIERAIQHVAPDADVTVHPEPVEA